MTTDDETEAANRMQAAFEAVHEAVARLLQEGEHDPQHLVLALARATGELGADIAQAGGMEAEELLDDLAELVRLAGEEPPVAGERATLTGLLGGDLRPVHCFGACGVRGGGHALRPGTRGPYCGVIGMVETDDDESGAEPRMEAAM